MLGVLFSPVLDTVTKKNTLREKYGITLNEEVDSMLYSQKVAGGEWQKKAEEVDAEIKKAREEKEESVLKLADKQFSVGDIADILSLSVDVVKEILAKRTSNMW